MYFSLNKEKIVFHQNSGITVRINGPEETYYVELREFLKDKSLSYFVDGYEVALQGKEGIKPEFHSPILFYGDYEISVYKKSETGKLVRIYTHRYNDYGKLVKFKFDSKERVDCEVWYEKVMEYQKLHGCKVLIDSPFEDINKRVNPIYELLDIDYYKTYYIGRYPKEDDTFKSNINEYWSYKNPKNWESKSPSEIASDILGLN